MAGIDARRSLENNALLKTFPDISTSTKKKK